ncbi:unnamed protein product [marine sediment metagenome]|uniref:SCP2 domain-containing protein n=1 Tax=marine sediment metagenome TaxID=412755 RepID=X1BER7_9ZZZZ
MFKLLSPDKWLERLYPVLQQRAHKGGLARPLEITLDVDGQIYRLTLTRRSVRLQPVSPSNCAHSPGQVVCDWLAFQDLLTSNLRVSTAIAQGRLATATPDISQALAILFPFRLFWQSPFELLRL